MQKQRKFLAEIGAVRDTGFILTISVLCKRSRKDWAGQVAYRASDAQQFQVI